jgi:hypothetical protein
MNSRARLLTVMRDESALNYHGGRKSITPLVVGKNIEAS